MLFLGGLIAAEYLKSVKNISLDLQWGEENSFNNGSKTIICQTNNDLLRALSRSFAENELYGGTPLEKTEVDHWLTISLKFKVAKNDFKSILSSLAKSLDTTTYLACKRLTIADFAVFSSLFGLFNRTFTSNQFNVCFLVTKQWNEALSKKEVPPSVLRWFSLLKSVPAVAKTLSDLPKEAQASLAQVSSRQSVDKASNNVGNRAQEGKFIELPNAEMGKVVVRFPPEASG